MAAGRVVAVLFLTVVGISFCSATFDFSHELGLKTPYWIQQNSSEWTPPPSSCYPIHLNLVARHGSRNPTHGDVKQMAEFQSIIESHMNSITNPDFQWLRDWKSPFTEWTAGELVLTGQIEHYNLAKRMMDYFPNIFKLPYTARRYPIRSTQISRTGVSGSAFGYGVFEDKGQIGPGLFSPFFIITANQSIDAELRFFSICPTYQKQVINNKSASIEADTYREKILPGIAERLTARINVAGWTVSPTEAEYFWKGCQFQASIFGNWTKFCSLFTKEDVDNLNYLADIDSYWMKGYGFPIDYTISCPLLQSFVQAIDDAISADNDFVQSANLRFAHAETVMPFIALLGLYNDSKPLRANSTPEEIANRQWRSGVLAPYASNIAFVTYNCTSNSGEPDDFRVRVLVNEKEMKLPHCQDVYCPVKTLKAAYNKDLQCPFNQMCGIRDCSYYDKSNSDDMWNLDSTGGIVIIIVALCVGTIGGLAFAGIMFWVFRRLANKQRKYSMYRGMGDYDRVVNL